MKNNEVLGDFILGGGGGGGGGREGKGKKFRLLAFFESRTLVRSALVMGRPGTGNRSKRPSNLIHGILTQHP